MWQEDETVDGLTPRQIQVLQLIADFQSRQCYSPTMAELAAEMQISRSTVFEHIGELQRKGLLGTSQGRARSLKVTSRGSRLLERMASRGAADEGGCRQGVPFVGRVAAGMPQEAVQNEERLSFESCFGYGDDLFAVEVSGDSMIDEDIRPGDYVLCRRTNVAENGSLVVALLEDGETTLKRLFRESKGIRLQPANTAYEPLTSINCQIEGVVVGLVRRF
jgi:repressor LexA